MLEILPNVEWHNHSQREYGRTANIRTIDGQFKVATRNSTGINLKVKILTDAPTYLNRIINLERFYTWPFLDDIHSLIETSQIHC